MMINQVDVLVIAIALGVGIVFWLFLQMAKERR